MKKGTILLLPICMLLTLVLTSFVSSPAARASATSPILGHVYHIVNRNSGKLMEVYNNDSSDGAKVDQWGVSGCQCQDWQFEIADVNSSSSGTTDDTEYIYSIVNEGTGGYLGVPQSSSAGTQVEDFIPSYSSSSSPSGYGTNLEWTINETEYPGYATITNVSSGLVLGIDQGSKADGAKVVQWQDNGTPDHEWNFECVASCSSSSSSVN
jgi:hypothetical protein